MTNTNKQNKTPSRLQALYNTAAGVVVTKVTARKGRADDEGYFYITAAASLSDGGRVVFICEGVDSRAPYDCGDSVYMLTLQTANAAGKKDYRHLINADDVNFPGGMDCRNARAFVARLCKDLQAWLNEAWRGSRMPPPPQGKDEGARKYSKTTNALRACYGLPPLALCLALAGGALAIFDGGATLGALAAGMIAAKKTKGEERPVFVIKKAGDNSSPVFFAGLNETDGKVRYFTPDPDSARYYGTAGIARIAAGDYGLSDGVVMSLQSAHAKRLATIDGAQTQAGHTTGEAGAFVVLFLAWAGFIYTAAVMNIPAVLIGLHVVALVISASAAALSAWRWRRWKRGTALWQAQDKIRRQKRREAWARLRAIVANMTTANEGGEGDMSPPSPAEARAGADEFARRHAQWKAKRRGQGGFIALPTPRHNELRRWARANPGASDDEITAAAARIFGSSAEGKARAQELVSYEFARADNWRRRAPTEKEAREARRRLAIKAEARLKWIIVARQPYGDDWRKVDDGKGGALTFDKYADAYAYAANKHKRPDIASRVLSIAKANAAGNITGAGFVAFANGQYVGVETSFYEGEELSATIQTLHTTPTKTAALHFKTSRAAHDVAMQVATKNKKDEAASHPGRCGFFASPDEMKEALQVSLDIAEERHYDRFIKGAGDKQNGSADVMALALLVAAAVCLFVLFAVDIVPAFFDFVAAVGLSPFYETKERRLNMTSAAALGLPPVAKTHGRFWLVAHDDYARNPYANGGRDAWRDGLRVGRLYCGAWGCAPDPAGALLFSTPAKALEYRETKRQNDPRLFVCVVDIALADIPSHYDGRRSFVIYDPQTRDYARAFGWYNEEPQLTRARALAERFQTHKSADKALTYWRKYGASAAAVVCRIAN